VVSGALPGRLTGLLESATDEEIPQSRICSRAPGWHDPNDYVGCTGDALVCLERHA